MKSFFYVTIRILGYILVGLITAIVSYAIDREIDFELAQLSGMFMALAVDYLNHKFELKKELDVISKCVTRLCMSRMADDLLDELIKQLKEK